MRNLILWFYQKKKLKFVVFFGKLEFTVLVRRCYVIVLEEKLSFTGLADKLEFMVLAKNNNN